MNGDVKVGDVCVTTFIEENVIGFEVTVNDVCLMEVEETVEELIG